MKLVMLVENQRIDAVTVQQQLLTLPGYISGKKRALLQQNAEALRLAAQEPVFLLQRVSSGNNTPGREKKDPDPGMSLPD
ncbi:MAG TPA: hypothetical protein VGN63_00930 [Flavisolibacter sp.]|jgi:hypothetical protein|nr:hypothetical protein [Flavisolibacter sp.]